MTEKMTFRSYNEVKKFVMNALTVRDYTSIKINRKRNNPVWEVEMVLPSIQFCKEYILSEKA